jgi:AraC-like DNA-binding protein
MTNIVAADKLTRLLNPDIIYHILINMAYRVIYSGAASRLEKVLPLPSACGMDTVSTMAYQWRGSERKRDVGVQVFQYSLSGCGAIAVKGVQHRVPAGSGFLCNLYDPHVIYYYPAEATEPWRFIYLTFRHTDDWVRAINAAGGYVYSIPDDCSFLRQLERLHREGKTSLSLALDAGLDLINMLFLEICRSLERRESRSRGQRLARQAIAHMQERVESADSVSTIAARLGVSTEHLCRVFRKEMNVSPLVYFQRQKLRHASALLREGQMPIKEIAQRLGINNVANFTRLFKQHMGIPPGKFRDGVGPVIDPFERE